MNAWLSPFIVSLFHPDWKLATALTARFDHQFVYGRYIAEGYGYYKYDLYCVVPRDRIPDEGKRIAFIDELQKFAFAFKAGAPDDRDHPELVED